MKVKVKPANGRYNNTMVIYINTRLVDFQSVVPYRSYEFWLCERYNTNIMYYKYLRFY